MKRLNDQNTFKNLELLEHEASNFGFKWENAHQIMDQIKSECDEITEHLDSTNPKVKPMLQMRLVTCYMLLFHCVYFATLTQKKRLKKVSASSKKD